MAAIDDAKTVINILTNGTADNAQMLRIADRFVTYAGSGLAAVDPENPTNEEKAQNFLDMIRRFGRSVLRGDATKEARAANDATVEAAAATAEADL